MQAASVRAGRSCCAIAWDYRPQNYESRPGQLGRLFCLWRSEFIAAGRSRLPEVYDEIVKLNLRLGDLNETPGGTIVPT